MKSYHLRIDSIGNFHLEDFKLLKTLQNSPIEVCYSSKLSLALCNIRKITSKIHFHIPVLQHAHLETRIKQSAHISLQNARTFPKYPKTQAYKVW